MDHRYAPPQAEVKDATPAEPEFDPSIDPATSSRSGRVHVWVAATLMFAAAIGLFYDVMASGDWIWSIAVVVFALAGGLLLMRSFWARYLIWLSAALCTGVWLYAVIPTLRDSWETDFLATLAACLVIVFPIIGISAYCVYVAHAYTRR